MQAALCAIGHMKTPGIMSYGADMSITPDFDTFRLISTQESLDYVGSVFCIRVKPASLVFTGQKA
jgi:hypothetical protein